MANAVEYIDRDDDQIAGDPPAPPLPKQSFNYIGTVQVRQSGVSGPVDLSVGYVSGAPELIIGPFTLTYFEVHLLMNAIKQGMDQILLDHETVRHVLRHSEGRA